MVGVSFEKTFAILLLRVPVVVASYKLFLAIISLWRSLLSDLAQLCYHADVYRKVTNGLLLHGVVFTQALTLALAYTYAQENQGRQITFFVITLPVQWLPYVMLLMTFVMGGPDAALGQATGLLAAHLYDFLTRLYPEFGGGRNFIQTPALVKRWFGGDQPGPATRSYGTAFAARSTSQQSQDASSGSSSGIATGVSNIWGSRGAGRRLGGD
ncbi:MAG: hypothetical protein M1836_002449 [Candelina mexicana]|nr:MAG: hypothetical protein M1836_002449 [Candelina mexicana]